MAPKRGINDVLVYFPLARCENGSLYLNRYCSHLFFCIETYQVLNRIFCQRNKLFSYFLYFVNKPVFMSIQHDVISYTFPRIYAQNHTYMNGF